MKKLTVVFLAGALLFSSGCSSMSRHQKIAVGATVAAAAVITLIILGSKNKHRHKHHHHESHHRGCRCHICHH